jgi:phage terminase large subunit-like protein
MRKLMQSPDVAKAMEQAAENAQRYAESIAPRDTGTYAESFDVETRVVGDRATAVLFNRAKYATVIEIRHRVLGRATDHARP